MLMNKKKIGKFSDNLLSLFSLSNLNLFYLLQNLQINFHLDGFPNLDFFQFLKRSLFCLTFSLCHSKM